MPSLGIFGRYFFGEIMSDETMDIESAAAFLKLTKRRLYQLIRKNEIPCYRPGGRKIIFFREELKQFVIQKKESQRKKSALMPG
jgi:excisionase family DNA binding protein